VYQLDDDYAFITYVPDTANVRKKMLYASSANTVQRQLGGSERFKHSLYWNDISEVSSRGWQEHLTHINAANPTTEEEEAETEGRIAAGTGNQGGRSHLAEVGSEDVWRSLDDKETVVKFVQNQPASGSAMRVRVDGETERLYVEPQNHGIKSEQDFFAEERNPGYFLYPHTNGTLYFVYVCPPSSSMRNKMLYSFKKDIVARLVDQHKASPIQVVEASEPDDLKNDVFAPANEKGPEQPQPVNKPRFNRPKPPGRR
jgi:twinfilin-like protein